MVRRLFVIPLVIVLAGCGKSHDVVAVTATPVTADDLSGQVFNVLSKNDDESVILLGHLRFDPVQGTDVSGTWDLRQWSGPAAIPDLPSSGAFSGSLDASTLILKLTLTDSTNSVGIFSRGFVAGRLSGTLSLLPSQRFNAKFEAIRADRDP